MSEDVTVILYAVSEATNEQITLKSIPIEELVGGTLALPPLTAGWRYKIDFAPVTEV